MKISEIKKLSYNEETKVFTIHGDNEEAVVIKTKAEAEDIIEMLNMVKNKLN